MTADELKNEVSGILKDAHSAQLYLVLKQNKELVLKLADTEDKSTTPEILRMFSELLKARIVAKDDLVLRNLSVADESQDAIYEYDYDSYPDELNLVKQFNIKEAVCNIKHFNFKTDDLNHLFGYIIYIGSMDNGLVIFKKHYPISLIKQGSFLLGAIRKNERFEKLPGDNILRLNNEAELLCVKNTIFVFNLKVLERNMGFLALIQRAAREAIDSIESLDILDDITKLRDELTEPTFARKLSKIKNASPIFELGITKEAIIEFTRNTPELKGKFKYSEDGTKIKLVTKKDKNAFLKLLNDEFLRSELTKQYYEAASKDILGSA